MNILFYGQSAVASLYGWALAKAGHSVEFWERGGEENTSAITSIKILDARSNPRGITVSEPWVPVIKSSLPVNQPYDLCVVAVRHDRLKAALKDVETNIEKATVLVLGNVWGNPKELSTGPLENRLAWAYPSAGGSVDDQGTFSGALLANVHVGTFETDPTTRQQSIMSLFREAGFRVEEHWDFQGWLWLQFVVGAGLAAQSLQAGSVERLVGSPVQLKKAILTIRELFPVVAARGIELRRFSAETAPFAFPAWLGGLILQTTLRSQEPVRTIWEAGDDEERQLVCREVLAEARRLKVSVPRLEAGEPLFTPS